MKAGSLGTVLVLVACVALTGCAGGGGGGTPLPRPTATPAPDYFPMSNSASWDVAMPPGSPAMSIWSAALGVRSTYGASCDSAAGVIGEYFANPDLLVPDAEQTTTTVTGTLSFTYSNLSVTKDPSNNLIVDGYVAAGLTPGPLVCVTPYVLMKSNAKAGDSWSYTDIAGRAITANVVFDHKPETYNPVGQAPQSYTSVTEVDYGADFTIDWALGYGPVQVIEHNTSGAVPLSYTAYDYNVSH